jgi:hypothetical protein
MASDVKILDYRINDTASKTAAQTALAALLDDGFSIVGFCISPRNLDFVYTLKK